MSGRKGESITLNKNELNPDEYTIDMSVDAIPDTDEILEYLNNAIIFIDTPAMQLLEVDDNDKFENILHEKYNSRLPNSMIKLLCSKERENNIGQMVEMLCSLSDIKQGKKDLMEETKKFSEKQSEKYIYSKFGGKNKFIDKMSKKN